MRNLVTFICLVCFVSSSFVLNAQETANISKEALKEYKKRSPLYDYSEANLNNTDSIPDFESSAEKLKITGTVFKDDGVTPAKDVILFIYQASESGDFEMKMHNKKRYVYHRAWVKTNADGQYTFYTFVPTSDVRTRELKQIHTVVKEPNRAEEYTINGFFFDNDPFLTKSCRKKFHEIAPNCILKLEKKEEMHFATRDIILKTNKNRS